jgi:hypothetical protein
MVLNGPIRVSPAPAGVERSRGSSLYQRMNGRSGRGVESGDASSDRACSLRYKALPAGNRIARAIEPELVVVSDE